jgi:hypothetical protein
MLKEATGMKFPQRDGIEAGSVPTEALRWHVTHNPTS